MHISNSDAIAAELHYKAQRIDTIKGNDMIKPAAIDPALIELCAREREIRRRRDDLFDQCALAPDLIETLDRDQDRLDRDIAQWTSASTWTSRNIP
jgi:hypothetical protein